jgi:glycosyltransferase involved in cell wall biosynthesis
LTSNCTSTDDFSQKQHPIVIHQSKIISLPVITFLHRPFKLLGRIFPSFKTLSKGPIFKYLPLKKIISFKPDYILAGPLPTTIILYARFIQLITKSKLVINPCFHPKDPDFQTPILLSILKKSDYLWPLTNYEKNYFQKNLKITHPQYFVHGLGVDDNFIINEKNIHYPKKPNLVFIANFSAHKRTELLITAFNLVLKKYPEASLTLLGQKTLYFPKITAFLKIVPIKTKSKIKFIFNPTQTQIKLALDKSSFLILPSIHESFGLVFVESLARGKAIIGADTPQSSEVIKTLGGGLTFKTDSVDNLYQTICQLIESPQLSKKLALTGYQNVKNTYTWNKIGEKLCQKLGI